MTIPLIMADIQNREIKTAFKKIYSDLSQATSGLVSENGGSLVGLCSDEAHDCLINKYDSYIKYMKKCANGTSVGKCWQPNDGSSKFLTGGAITTWDAYPAYVLNSGAFVKFYWGDDACANTWVSGVGDCGYIAVDVNGLKGPNTIGRDLLYIHIHKNKLKPFGNPDDNGNASSDVNTCVKTQNGFGCAYNVLMDIDY